MATADDERAAQLGAFARQLARDEAYLRKQAAWLPSLRESLVSLRMPAPSRVERELDRIASRPGRWREWRWRELQRLGGAAAGGAPSVREVAAASLMFCYAEQRLGDATQRDVQAARILLPGESDETIARLARECLVELHVQRGRGGVRRKRRPGAEIALEHALEIWEGGARRYPTVSNNHARSPRIGGPSVEFAELILGQLGFLSSRAQLRRGIDAYARRARAKRGPHGAGRLGITGL